MRHPSIVSCVAVLSLFESALAQHMETEPNHTKAQAAANGALLLAAGSAIVGTTTGSSVLPGATGTSNADTFLIQTVPMPAGIYRHRLAVTSATVGHTLTIRATNYPDPTDDEIAQTSSSASGRRIQWFGFGRSERLYVRVTGSATTTAAYTLSFTTQSVAPAAIPGSFMPGEIVLSSRNLTTFDTEVHVYDGSLVELRDYQNDDPYVAGGARFELARSYAPGTYYVAAGRYNLISTYPETSRFDGDPNYQGYAGSLGGEANPNYQILDFADGICTSYSSTVSTPVTFSVTDALLSPLVVPAAVGVFEIAWFRMEVGPYPCVAPSISASPASLEVCYGNSASFHVSATGTGPLSYQWTWNGSPIPLGDGASLTIPQVDFGFAGSYACTVSNACGSATSEPATLFVHPAGPEITEHPAPLTLCVGEQATFAVSASGHMQGALTYQWMKDGVPISGATARTLSFVVSDLGEAGSYLCRVTEEGCGSSDSSAALLTLRNATPVIELVGDPSINIECGHEHYVELGAIVYDDCDSAIEVRIGGDAVNSYAIGHYVVTYDATDSQGNAAARIERHVFVVDAEAPEVHAEVATSVLWSPNHELVDVGLEVEVHDHCSPQTAAESVVVAVYGNEPELSEKGDGSGQEAPDAVDIAAGTLRLRSERCGGGGGRVYVIVVSTKDGSGNAGFAFATVVCPSSHSHAALSAVRTEAESITADLVAAAGASERLEDVQSTLAAAGYRELGLEAQQGPQR